MTAKLHQISRLLKRYDSDLYPQKFADGALGIMRKKWRWDFMWMPHLRLNLWFQFRDDHLVLPITDNWQDSGNPVDWGIEPILQKIQQLDGWRDDGDYDRFVKDRENRKADKHRAHRNEMRALAADCRKEFAQATNDINTSTLEKVDKRRMYGNRR